jgi:hypothetical protein
VLSFVVCSCVKLTPNVSPCHPGPAPLPPPPRPHPWACAEKAHIKVAIKRTDMIIDFFMVLPPYMFCVYLIKQSGSKKLAEFF